MAYEWKRVGKEVTTAGTTITYAADGCNWVIESRKRHIPHSGRPGYWDHTTYAIVLPGEQPFLVYECQSLADAREFIEKQKIKPLSELYRREDR